MHKILARELQIYLRRKSESIGVILFFVMIVSLYPLALGPIPKDLSWLIPGIIWIAALLSSILAQESLLRADYQLGIFEQMLLSDRSFAGMLATKIFAHWLITGLSLVLITPCLAISLGLPVKVCGILTASLLIGTPILSVIAALGSALTLSLPRSGVLLAILVLPLYIPVLVLGAASGINAINGLNVSGHLCLLLALAIISLIGVTFAVSSIIKVSIT